MARSPPAPTTGENKPATVKRKGECLLACCPFEVLAPKSSDTLFVCGHRHEKRLYPYALTACQEASK